MSLTAAVALPGMRLSGWGSISSPGGRRKDGQQNGVSSHRLSMVGAEEPAWKRPQINVEGAEYLPEPPNQSVCLQTEFGAAVPVKLTDEEVDVTLRSVSASRHGSAKCDVTRTVSLADEGQFPGVGDNGFPARTFVRRVAHLAIVEHQPMNEQVRGATDAQHAQRGPAVGASHRRYRAMVRRRA
jgi:hypothetical protein